MGGDIIVSTMAIYEFRRWAIVLMYAHVRIKSHEFQLFIANAPLVLLSTVLPRFPSMTSDISKTYD